MTAIRWPVLAFLTACLLSAPNPATAMAIANSTLSFENLTIAPAVGTLSLDGPWILETYAQTDNSLGETDANFTFELSPNTIGAVAAINWASASGAASAPNDPPDYLLTGSGTSNTNVPGCDPAFASSKGRGTIYNFFTLSHVGTVQFGIDIFGLLNLMTDVCGVEASSEVNFSLAIDGNDPLLFFSSSQIIGHSDSLFLPIAMTLSNAVLLDAGSHFLLLEADSESRALVEVPAPPAGLLLLIGLTALAIARRRLLLVPRVTSWTIG